MSDHTNTNEMGRKDAALLGLLAGLGTYGDKEEKLDNPMKFVSDMLKEAGEEGNVGKTFRLPWVWDDPDTGMGEVANALLFIDEVLQGRPDGLKDGLTNHAQAGLGSICRLLSDCVSHYRTQTFNALDELQRAVRAQQENRPDEQEVDNNE